MRDTIEPFVWATSCFVIAYLLMRQYRGYIEAWLTRDQDEPWVTTVKRAGDLHRLNAQATIGIFGTRWWTIGGRLLVAADLFGTMMSLTVSPMLTAVIFVYHGLGIYLVFRWNVPKCDQWERLLKRDKATFYILHGALWPIHYLRQREQTSLKKG